MSEFEEWVAAILEIAPAEVTDDLGPATHGGWTSLRHVQLVSAAQRRYEIRFTPREIRSVRCVRDLRVSLRDKGVPV